MRYKMKMRCDAMQCNARMGRVYIYIYLPEDPRLPSSVHPYEKRMMMMMMMSSPGDGCGCGCLMQCCVVWDEDATMMHLSPLSSLMRPMSDQ